jgi:hypothetical protein
VTLHCAIGRAGLVLLLGLVLVLVLVLVLRLVALAVTAVSVVELLLRPQLGAHLILRSWRCLVGLVVSIPGTLGIDTGGNRLCRVGCVGLGSSHPCGDGEQSDRGECQHHLSHDHSFPSVSSRRRCRNLFPGLRRSSFLHHPSGQSRIKGRSRTP